MHASVHVMAVPALSILSHLPTNRVIKSLIQSFISVVIAASSQGKPESRNPRSIHRGARFDSQPIASRISNPVLGTSRISSPVFRASRIVGAILGSG